MEENAKKNWIRRFFASRLFLVVAFVLIFLTTAGYFRAYYQDFRIKQEIRELENEVRALEGKKIESMEILQYVMSQGYVEEKARVELSMKKPGEKMVILKNMDTNEGGGESGLDVPGRNLTNPVKWLYYFLHKNI